MKPLTPPRVLALILVLLFANSAWADEECLMSELFPIFQDVSGGAQLCLSPKGAKGLITAKGLTAGEAYTVWFVYFDDPASCATPFACDLPDFAGDNPQAVFGRFASAVAPRNGHHVFKGEVGGFQPSSGSQVWLLILGHGPADYADGRHLARQLLTPEDPAAGAPHLGNVVDGPGFQDAGIAVFVTP